MKAHYFESELKMPGGIVRLPLRCTFLTGPGMGILISPVKFNFKQIMELKSLGPVTDIVAPSLLHHLYVGQTRNHFPEARIWGLPGMQQKDPMVNWKNIIGRDHWPYSDQVAELPVNGVPRMDEVVFFVKSERLLVVTDLCFNLQKPKGWAAPVMLRFLGTYKKLAVSRLINRFMEDRAAFESSIRRIMEWDFDKIAMAHGELVSHDGKALLRRAFRRRGFMV
jgi:hypothetical protein